MSSFLRSAAARSSSSPPMPARSTGFEERPMLEPLFGLFVALALGAYLVVTLLRPERF
ncbi:K(+)-transporting ATPase subunit F [Shinella sp. G-2]